MKYTQKKALRWMVAMGLTMTAFSWGNVEAMPTGGEVRSGDAEIKTSGQTMDIDQKTSRVALDWTGFDIAKGETVRFHQNPSDIAINRILGNKASEIYGNLQAGGTVFLLNPQGILFGQGAQVDVGNLIASTAQVDDSFMKGFSAGGDVSLNLGEASKGKVINAGDIKAQGGLVALHAANVENTGSIINDGGKVSLSAVKNLELAIDTAGKINFETSGETANAHTLNAGTIQADGGYVVMTAKSAGDMLSEVVNNTGIIEAKTASINDKGEILLDGGDHGTVNVSGTLDASGLADGQSGGTVRILGENTSVKDGAKLTASGDKDGGLVETSGDVLDVSTKADIEAKGRTGKAGEWLLDPLDVVIADSKPSGYTEYKPIKEENTVTSDKRYSFINAGSINNMLNNGTSVTIQAIDKACATNKDSNIAVNSAIKKEAGGDATLTLEAERNIYVNAEISSSSNNLNVVLHADSDSDRKGMVVVANNINTNGGNFLSGTGGSIKTEKINGKDKATLVNGGTVGTYFGPYDVTNKLPANDKGNDTNLSLTTNGGDVELYGDVALGLNKGKLTIDTTGKNGTNGAVTITANVDSLNTYNIVNKDYSGIDNIIEEYYNNYLRNEKKYYRDFTALSDEERKEVKDRYLSQKTGHEKDNIENYYNNNVKITDAEYAKLDDGEKAKIRDRLLNTDSWTSPLRESILKRWDLAKEAAKEGTHGLNNVGDKYLATITTALEDWVISSRLVNYNGQQFLVGGHTYDLTGSQSRVFLWETGPESLGKDTLPNGEKGTVFYTTADASHGYVAVDMYQGWTAGDPDNGFNGSGAKYGQPCVALTWRDSTLWSDVDDQKNNVYGFIQETNSEHSSLDILSGNANVAILGNIGKSARLNTLTIDTGGDVKIGTGLNRSSIGAIDVNGISKESNYTGEIRADSYRIGRESIYNMGLYNSVERPQFAPLSFTTITGEAGYREVQDEKISSVEQVLGLTTAKLPLVKEVNGTLTSYGTYQLAVAPDKVTMELADTSVPVPANSIHDQYREYTKNLTTKRGAADFKLSYDGSVFALHPIGQEAEKMLEAGDAAHNVDVVSQALYTAFHDMGLTLDDLDAVYVCFA